MKKVILLIMALFATFFSPNCILEPDREYLKDSITVKIHDTVKITKTIYDTILKNDTLIITKLIHDTLIKHDTLVITKFVHDTLIKHDTLIQHDTLKTFATNTISSSLLGVWRGVVAGKLVTLAFATSSAWAFDYTANIGSDSYEGKVKTFSNNVANCEYMNGPGMIGETANWIISISNNILTLQQIGYPMFPTMDAFTLGRIL